MNDQSKMLAIAVLCLTAVVLLCTVLILDRMPLPQAQASGPLDRQGDYIMLPGTTARGDQVVYIIDVASRKMAAYGANLNQNRVEVRAIFDLATLPK